MAGIYIHIPFCRSKCTYCDFYSVTDCGDMGAVLRSISSELRTRSGFLEGEQIKTIYFGGGTPSLCSPDELQQLITVVKELWPGSDIGEITVEANPDDLTPSYLAALASTDINRLSIGIQSFDDRHLRFMNRRHNAQAAVRAVRDAQQAGFDNITTDLIYGIPTMTLDVWRSNIEQTIDLGVQHISAYHLTIEEGTPLDIMRTKGLISPVGESDSEEQYFMLREMLASAGFEHYEVSNFALPGFRAAHNSSYWSGERYLGVGPSAHSYDGKRRLWAAASIEDYIVGGEIYSQEELTPADHYNEFVMTRLRTSDGVDVAVLEANFGREQLDRFEVVAQRFIALGVMHFSDGKYVIPSQKFLVSDAIISEFFIEV